MTDFPETLKQAENMEMYKGGLNGAIHLDMSLSLQDQILQSTHACDDCGREYLIEAVQEEKTRTLINKFMPEDGDCFDCGSN